MDTETKQMIREIHASVVGGTPAASELIQAARYVVAARYGNGEWEELSEAICRLAKVLEKSGAK